MNVSVNDLLTAVEAINIVPSRAGLVSTEFVKIVSWKNRLSFSLSAEIFGTTFVKTDSEEEWEFFVDRSTFIPFIMAAKELRQKGPFVFDLNGNRLSIKCGLRRAVFNATSSNIGGYATIKRRKDSAQLKLSREQQDLLHFASSYATEDPTIAELNCVYLCKGKSIIASSPLSAIVLDDRVVPMTAPLPLLLLKVLGNEAVKAIAVTENAALVELTHGYLCQYVNEKARAEFPAKRVLKALEVAKSYPVLCEVRAAAFANAMKRLQTYISAVVRRDLIVTAEGSKGDKVVTFISKTPSGTFRERVKATSPLVKDFQCDWLLNVLVPLVDIAPKLRTIAIAFGKDTPYYFSSSGLHLIVSRKQ